MYLMFLTSEHCLTTSPSLLPFPPQPVLDKDNSLCLISLPDFLVWRVLKKKLTNHRTFFHSRRNFKTWSILLIWNTQKDYLDVLAYGC